MWSAWQADCVKLTAFEMDTFSMSKRERDRDGERDRERMNEVSVNTWKKKSRWKTGNKWGRIEGVVTG